MRLSEYERTAIRETVSEIIPGAKILVYGSRADDSKRGGDIDLLILTDRDLDLMMRLKMEARIWQKIGEQKLDILIEKPGAISPFGQMVLSGATPL